MQVQQISVLRLGYAIVSYCYAIVAIVTLLGHQVMSWKFKGILINGWRHMHDVTFLHHLDLFHAFFWSEFSSRNVQELLFVEICIDYGENRNRQTGGIRGLCEVWSGWSELK